MIGILLAATVAYEATVLRVVDGDTLKVHVAGFPAFVDPIDVRVYGVDAPEHVKPPAKSRCEVALGLQARSFAFTLAHPGDQVTVTYTVGRNDKYGRLLGAVTLPDGRDWAAAMIASKLARPYGLDGKLTKARWC